MPGISGDIEIMNLEDKGYRCIAPELSSISSRYQTDINGFIRGRLEFSCLVNGLEFKARPYNVYFDIRPGIKSVDIDSVEYSDDGNFFKAYYTARFRGADLLEVLPKQEFSSVVVRSTYREPVIVQGSTSWLFTGGKVWLQFRVLTDSGEDTRTILFQPYTQEWDDVTRSTAAIPSLSEAVGELDDKAYTVDVYASNGSRVISGIPDTSLSLSGLAPGVYIVTRRFDNGNVQSYKIRIK